MTDSGRSRSAFSFGKETGHHEERTDMDAPDFDVLIVGAGISGIGMAAHLERDRPGSRYAVLERRGNIGGTWDLFRYPGIRSDSDMHTLGFVFEPWREQKAIADGPSILAYLKRIVAERGIDRHIRTGTHVQSAAWSSADARWTVSVRRADGKQETLTARFLYMGAGYYDYDQGHDPDFAGRERFAGQVVHPQFWPEGLDWRGKKVVVIGSGATAVTLVPALARDAAHVTMLQRTPTWYFVRPSEDRLANFLRRILPDRWAYDLIRFRNVRFQDFAFRRARKDPAKMGEALLSRVRDNLGGQMDERDFRPPYGPWEQRLCLVPDSDMFRTIRDGKAAIVTDHVERFDETGIVLQSGRRLDADIIVTATGLQLAVAGKVAVSVDGEPVRWNERFYYKGCMFSNLPNYWAVFGYLNASWTLKADIVSAYAIRVMRHMDAVGATVALPALSPAEVEEADAIFDFSSGYLQRALPMLPRNGAHMPWKLNQDYLLDRRILLRDPVGDGHLRFGNGTSARRPAVAEADELAAAE